ncbi:Kazal-type serine protease inhibitor [Nanoarchaeota archaeon]
MGDRRYVMILCILVIVQLMLVTGCITQYARPEGIDDPGTDEEKDEIVSTPKAVEKESEAPDVKEEIDVSEKAASSEEKSVVSEEEDVEKSVETPVKTAAEEADTCGCSFTWDPVCGIDAKTYINECLFRCAGNSLELLNINNQCPKKGGTIKIYADDFKISYESDKSNGAYCWRQMLRNEGLRHCDNIITNGRINIGPEPLNGNWIDPENLVFDKFGRKESYSFELEVGDMKSNEEYGISYQPLFEKGEYMFSFWARQDIVAGNDWKVKLILRDWSKGDGKPDGVESCYEVSTEIDAQDVYIDVRPNKWRHYHYVFDVPLKTVQWQKGKRDSSSCEYPWDQVPHGYRVEVEGPSFGRAWFDDFSLMKTG